MSDAVHPAPPAPEGATDLAAYQRQYEAAARDPDGFWREEAKRLDWVKAPTRIKDTSFDAADFRIRWFADGVLNVSANCLDRHLGTCGESKRRSCGRGTSRARRGRSATASCTGWSAASPTCCKANGVAKGDRVTLYLPMVAEAAAAMLACARIGAVHSIVFGGFSPDSLAGRIEDCGSRLVITADEGRRGWADDPAQGERRRGAGALCGG